MYKKDAGDTSCDVCPGNSDSLTTGSISCQCLTGYYRATDETDDVACTGKFVSCESILVSVALFKQAKLLFLCTPYMYYYTTTYCVRVFMHVFMCIILFVFCVISETSCTQHKHIGLYTIIQFLYLIVFLLILALCVVCEHLMYNVSLLSIVHVLCFFVALLLLLLSCTVLLNEYFLSYSLC